MQQLYGKLNIPTIKKDYAGLNSETANIKVDNESYTIKVDVKKVPKTITFTYSDGSTEIFDGSQDVNVEIVTKADLEDKQAVIDADHKLDSALIDDSLSENKFVSSSEKQDWNSRATTTYVDTAVNTMHSKSIPDFPQTAEKSYMLVYDTSTGNLEWRELT